MGRGKTILLILAAAFIALAFALRAILPQNSFVPGGWPPGSHWYRTSWVAFWVSLVAGIAILIVVVASIILSKRT